MQSSTLSGETEEECKTANIQYVVGKDKYSNHGRGQIIGDTEGMIKMIFEVLSGTRGKKNTLS